MSADLPRSPHSGACAVLGLFCSHAAYCTFYMFESLNGLMDWRRGGGWGRGGGGGGQL